MRKVMFGDQSIVYTWSQSWNLWDQAAIIPVYSQMRGWTNIVEGVCDGIDELLGTVDKTKRMGYENLNRSPGATICRGLAQMLWIPVLLRVTYKMGSFFYYSIRSPSVGFTLYKHAESTNAHYLAGKKHLEKKEYQLAVDAFVRGIDEGDIDSVYMRAWIWLKEMDYDDKMPKNEIEILLQKASHTDIRAEFLYNETDGFISDYKTRAGVFLRLAKQGFLPAIGKLANFNKEGAVWIEEYVKKGSIALEKEDPTRAAKFYVELANVFDRIENPTAQKRLLEKAAALCTVDTIVEIAAYYYVTNPLAYDPFLATIDSYNSGDEESARRFHDIGYNCKSNKNFDLAEKYYLKAANLGRTYSMIGLTGVLSEKEDLSDQETKQNNEKILSWLHKAADLKDSQAYTKLGWAYQKGLYGLDKNIHTAITYFEKGADEGNDIRDFIIRNREELAKIYEERGDLEKALVWYRKAKELRIKVGLNTQAPLVKKIEELEIRLKAIE